MAKIVGHRGAKGLEHENTIKGFKLAKSLGVTTVEFDVMATRDGKFVVCHDLNLKRLTGKRQFVQQMDYADLAEIYLSNGETIPLLYDVLALLKDTAVVLDIKTDTHLDALFEIIDRYPDMNITVTAWLHPHVTRTFKHHRPHIPAFIERYYNPIGLMRAARKYKADGINLYHPWLNPLTYLLAKRKGLQIQVYTVNKVWHARLIARLYPDVWICTNYPDTLMKYM